MTLSTQENTKLLQQLKSGFKSIINWNKYLSNPELLAQNPNLSYLIEPSFQEVNRLFVLAFENDTQRISYSDYYLPNVEIGCLLEYSYFMDTYKVIGVDLSKQQALDADARAIQRINVTANLNRAGNTRVYFILKEAKETILDFSQGTLKVL